MTNLIPGKWYRATFVGVADIDGAMDCGFGSLDGFFDSGDLDCAINIEQLPDPGPPMPRWQVGDVIAWDEGDGPMTPSGPKVRHVAMRDQRVGGVIEGQFWHDPHGRPVSDALVKRLWDAGQIELVARDGRPWPKDGAR